MTPRYLLYARYHGTHTIHLTGNRGDKTPLCNAPRTDERRLEELTAEYRASLIPEQFCHKCLRAESGLRHKSETYSAAWRSESPTSIQTTLLTRRGYEPSDIARLNRGKASDEIERITGVISLAPQRTAHDPIPN